MATKIAKLREDYKKELAERKRIMKDVVIERKKPIITNPSSDTHKKITLDSQKLQETISKAIETSESLKKKPIVVLDKIPSSSHNNPVVAAPVPVTICKARNLNGTPCKCKAVKSGKFCAKHTP